jgi:hypothetical protein
MGRVVSAPDPRDKPEPTARAETSAAIPAALRAGGSFLFDLDSLLFILGAILAFWWKVERPTIVVLVVGICLVVIGGVRAYLHYQERARRLKARGQPRD